MKVEEQVAPQITMGYLMTLIEMVLWLFTILQHASLKLFLCDDDSKWHHDAR